MFFYGRDARAGSLLSYGPDNRDYMRQVGLIPVRQSILVSADHVIE
jgi:hypothetical protein